LTIATLLLPVAGYLVRYIAFYGLNTDSGEAIDLAASIGTLAATGFFALLRAVPYLILLWLTLPFARSLRAADLVLANLSAIEKEIDQLNQDTKGLNDLTQLVKEQTSALKIVGKPGSEFAETVSEHARKLESVRVKSQELQSAWKRFERSGDLRMVRNNRPRRVWPRWLRWSMTVTGVLISILLVSVVAPFTDPLTGLLSLLPVIYILPRWYRRVGRFTLAMGVTTIGATLLIAAIGSGIGGYVVAVDTSTYSFKPDAQLLDGAYSRLGESDQGLYLRQCGSDLIVRVNREDVAHVAALPYKQYPLGPSLFQILIGHQTPILGYRPNC
jgi:hypothetical protein